MGQRRGTRMRATTGRGRRSRTARSGSSGAPAPRPVPPRDPQALLATVQTMAEKWMTAITGLTGLLGISGIAFGDDVLTDAGGLRQVALVLAFLVALLASAVALVACTGAAHGFPPLPGRAGAGRWKDAAAGWDRDMGRAERALESLWVAMTAALVAFGATIIALVLALV